MRPWATFWPAVLVGESGAESGAMGSSFGLDGRVAPPLRGFKLPLLVFGRGRGYRTAAGGSDAKAVICCTGSSPPRPVTGAEAGAGRRCGHRSGRTMDRRAVRGWRMDGRGRGVGGCADTP